MKTLTVRGAITVEKNDENDILFCTKELINKIILENTIDKKAVISIVFSVTKDLDQVYPAKGARELGFTSCSLMCFQEMHVKDSLTKCIRIMILFNSNKEQNELKHIYLKKAVSLRPDLVPNQNEKYY